MSKQDPDDLQLDFWLDMSSPYAYFASEKINALAESYGLNVHWHPFLLGAVFKETKSAALTDQHPWKAKYAAHDFVRTAELFAIPFQTPSRFPQLGVASSRAMLWIEKTHGQGQAQAYAHQVLRGLFTADADISSPEQIALWATNIGCDGQTVVAGMQQPEIKQALIDKTTQAMAQEIFGAPFFVLNGENFWGFDRLPQLEARIKQRVGGKSYKTLVAQANAKVKTLPVEEALALYEQEDVVFVDLRDPRELDREGKIPKALHAPRGMVEFWVDPTSPYYRKQFDPSKTFVFFCAAGWRSALTTEAVQEMGYLPKIAHLDGGFAAWKQVGAPVIKE